METPYESILLSKPFTFLIGTKKKEFTVHAAAFARLSKPLNDLLNGSMREAKDRSVHWEDVDEKTFVRLSQWAYAGDYTPAEPDILLDASHVAPNPQGSGDGHVTEHFQELPLYDLPLYSLIQQDSATLCGKCSQKDTVSKKLAMIERLNTSDEFPSPNVVFMPRKNTESCEHYIEVFLCHARLYVIADKYDITPLRQLSLHKLYVTLKEFTLYPSRIGDIMALIIYSFENTLESDKLRTLLVDYCACIVEDMVETEDFKKVIDEVPDFAFGLIKKMKDRLS